MTETEDPGLCEVDEHDADHGPGRAATMPPPPLKLVDPAGGVDDVTPKPTPPTPRPTVGPFSAPPAERDPQQAQLEAQRQRQALMAMIAKTRPDIAAALASGRPMSRAPRGLDLVEAALIGGMGGAGVTIAAVQSALGGAGIFGFALLLLLLKLVRRT